MRKWNFILSLLFFLLIGQILRTWAFNQLKEVPAYNSLGKINKAFKDTTTGISIWGSSTAYMNIIPDTLKKDASQTVYNYGISGAAYNQLHHLIHFANNNKNKTILWVINPYEFEIYDYKLEEKELFLQWNSKQEVISYLNKGNGFLGYANQYFGWYGISQLNAKHWNQIFNPVIDSLPNWNGFIGREKTYVENNNFYPTDLFTAHQNKIDSFKSTLKPLAQNNNLVLIIPPIINAMNFQPFARKLESEEYRVIDFSSNSSLKDTSLYQDNVHLNIQGAEKFTKALYQELYQ